MRAIPILEWISIALAFVATGCWFLSAAGAVPVMLPYWDAVPKDDPFYAAIVQSAHWNKIAAGLTGASVLLNAVATAVRKRSSL